MLSSASSDRGRCLSPLAHVPRGVLSRLVVRESIWMLRLQPVGLHHVKHLLWVVPLACDSLRLSLGLVSCNMAILLVIPLLERLHQLGLTCRHQMLDLHDIHFDGPMPLEGLAVLLLGLPEALDQRIFLFVDQLLVPACLGALVGLLPRQLLLCIVDEPLRVVRSSQGIFHIILLVLEFVPVLLEGLLKRLALAHLPIRKGRLLVRRPLAARKRGRGAQAAEGGSVGATGAAVRRAVAGVSPGSSVLLHWPGPRRRDADADAPLLALANLACPRRRWVASLRRAADRGLVRTSGCWEAGHWPLRKLRPEIVVQLPEASESLVSNPPTRHFDLLYFSF
mmetsp:Transcript_99321/g.259515  ORF Transcript_99321/g.259515 Transcript_99321/m.259515 type:complete len:337 (-) Transcript_99321:515-1525(-)